MNTLSEIRSAVQGNEPNTGAVANCADDVAQVAQVGGEGTTGVHTKASTSPASLQKPKIIKCE